MAQSGTAQKLLIIKLRKIAICLCKDPVSFGYLGSNPSRGVLPKNLKRTKYLEGTR